MGLVGLHGQKAAEYKEEGSVHPEGDMIIMLQCVYLSAIAHITYIYEGLVVILTYVCMYC